MMKFIPAIFLIIFSMSLSAQVTFKWIGTTTFMLTDQQTTLFFDPAMTRIPIYDYLPFRTVKSDPVEVDYWMNRCGLKSIQATFVNHAHTDHVIDAPYVVKKYGGKLYGSSSVINVGLGQGLNSSQLQKVSPDKEWKIGEFTVSAYITPHAPHFFDIMFMGGHIEKPLPSPTSGWNYLVGDTFSYLIKHPKGNILFQAIGKIYDQDSLKDIKADVLLLTIANRDSSEQLIQKRLLPSKAKLVIPLHHDNFFITMNRKGAEVSWASKIDEFTATMNQQAKHVILKWPEYCQGVTLLN